MNKIINYIKRRKQTRYFVSFFSKYIKRGTYLFSKEDQTYYKVNLFAVLMFWKIKNLFYFFGEGAIKEFEIKKGSEKINLITKSVVVSKYYISNVPLKKIENHIHIYLSKLNINHNSYLYFSAQENEIITPRIKGVVLNDLVHKKILLDAILKAAVSSEIVNLSNVCFYVQHGDAYGSNVIWKSNKEFITIDNEGVGLYPAFYDAFMLISINVNTAKQFMDICNRYIDYFYDFGRKNNINIDKNFFDYYVSLFVVFRMNSYFKNKTTIRHRPFLFLENDDSSNVFPCAKNTLQNIYKGIKNEKLDNLYKKING